MPLLIISCSLNKSSKSRELARVTRDHFAREKEECLFLDLAEFDIPLCDGDTAYEHPHVKKLIEIITQSSAIILAVPIYNFAASAAARNLIELTGNCFEGKVVGFICAAGGQKSYMSVMDLANSLMLHHRCVIVPQFVYSDNSAFSTNGSLDCPDIRKRIHLLLETTVRLRNALK